jgi:hypothetical protein
MGSSSNESQLLLAIEAIRKNPKLSLRAAAAIYQVPKTTLRARKAGQPSRRDIPPNLRKLTNSEESTLIQYILDLDLRAFPPRLSDVEDMANLLLAARNAPSASDASQPPPLPPTVGVNWASKFIKRQPQLRTRSNRRIDYQRVQCEDPVQYNAWFNLVRNTIAKYGIDASDIYNFDETGFAISQISATRMVVTSVERKERPRQTQPRNKE